MSATKGTTRRDFLRAGATLATASTFSSGGWSTCLAEQAAQLRREGRSLILLYMGGGPSQLETFDPKPGTDNGGPTQAISTAVPGIQIAAGWEQTAKQLADIAIIRSMTNKEGSHERAAYQLHTGYVPTGTVKHPSLGAAVAHQIAPTEFDLPAVVTVGQVRAGGIGGAGFLGVNYDPLIVPQPGSPPDNVSLQDDARLKQRIGLLDSLEAGFAQRGAARPVENHQRIVQRSAKLMLSPLTRAFEFDDEPAALRERYGSSEFGRGCLLARRLVETGVTAVEVRMNGWDTHQDNFTKVGELAREVDPALATLIADLKDRGRLDRTVVLWVGDFGRTPKINPRTGRDHFPRVFNALLAGGGIQGGQVIGRSSADGMAIADDPVTVPDLLASVCKALHVDPAHENMSPIGRPIKIVDGGKPIEKLFS